MKTASASQPPPERWVLSNGLCVLYRHSPAMPLVAGTLFVRAGSAQDEAPQAGLAGLTMDCLLSGTARRSAKQIAGIVEEMGASIAAQASEDFSEIGFVAPSSQWTQVLDVLGDLLAHTSFPAVEVAKERAQALAGLASRADAIFNVAYDRFSQLLCPGHPYGRPVDGTVPTVRRLRRTDTLRWHRSFVRPEEAILSLIGPLPGSRVSAALRQALEGWSNPGPLPATKVWPPCLGPGKDLAEQIQAKFEQAYLMTGVIAPSVHEDGYLVLKVLNTLLGGGMSSRLFLRLREELGLAYEVSSFYPTRLHASRWVLYLGLPKEKLSTAHKAMENLLDELVAKGPTPHEVEQAKQMIEGSYLMEHQTRRRQAWYAGWWELLGKGADYDSRFMREIRQVTPRAVHTLAKRLLAQPRVTVTVVPR